MLTLLKKSLYSMTRPYVLRYVLIALVITAVGFGLTFGGVTIVLRATQIVSWGWLDGVIDAALGASALWVSWLVFPLMIPLLAAFFGDAVAAKVEAEEYGVSGTPALPLWPQITGALKFLLASLGWNILALVLLVFPPVWLVVYYALNGWLLGRDFYDTVISRHVLPAQKRTVIKGRRIKIWAMGVALMLLSTVPVVNLGVPFIAVVAMVHLFRAYPAHTV